MTQSHVFLLDGAALSERPRLRLPALAAQREPAGLAALWSELVEGACAVSSAHTDERWLSLELVSPGIRRLSARERELLESYLAGDSQKALTFECSISAAGACATLKRARQALGLDGPCCAIPAAIMILSQVWRGTIRSPAFSIERRAASISTLRSLRIERPELELDGVLSTAERQLLRYLVDGRSYPEMARLRGTSQRTVANQIGHIYKTYGVSGRQELLCRILSLRHGCEQTATQ